MSWSKIQNTELASEAFVRIGDNGCQYHNFDHIDNMYKFLELEKVPYDEALDWAVLFHDVVYDSKPNKEERSAKFFWEIHNKYRGCNLNVEDVDRVQLLIMETKNHIVTKDCYLTGSSTIIRADLHALTDTVETINNFAKIMNESMILYGISVEEFAENNISFMANLRENMLSNLTMDNAHSDFYENVIRGIDLTVSIAKSIINNKRS
jgi:hypothetical protein